MNKIIHVTVYDCNKAFGGPEEGGWWYDFGILCTDLDFAEKIRIFPNNDEGLEKAQEYQKSLLEEIDKYNEEEGNVHPSQSICKGYYRALIREGLPENFPQIRPHYE